MPKFGYFNLADVCFLASTVYSILQSNLLLLTTSLQFFPYLYTFPLSLSHLSSLHVLLWAYLPVMFLRCKRMLKKKTLRKTYTQRVSSEALVNCCYSEVHAIVMGYSHYGCGHVYDQSRVCCPARGFGRFGRERGNSTTIKELTFGAVDVTVTVWRTLGMYQYTAGSQRSTAPLSSQLWLRTASDCDHDERPKKRSVNGKAHVCRVRGANWDQF